jgi:CRP-like cAMP-binding protein
MTLEDKVKALMATALFRAAARDVVSTLAEACTVEVLKKDRPVWVYDEAAASGRKARTRMPNQVPLDAAMLVLDGALLVMRSHTFFRGVGSGEYLGLCMAAAGAPLSASIATWKHSPVLVLVIPGPALQQAMAREMCIAQQIILGLAGRIHGLTDELRTHQQFSITQLVAWHLVQFIDARIVPIEASGTSFSVACTRDEFKNLSGVSEDQVDRAMKILRDKHILASTRTRGRLVILDMDALRAYVNHSEPPPIAATA